MDELVAVSLEGFVNISRAYAEHPTDKRVQALFTRQTLDLDRYLRLRDALRRN